VATNLQLDDELIKKALELGGHKTKKEAVNAALKEYTQRREQMKIIELFGTIEYDEDYDYKAGRQTRR
jgi:Arc/MetJ family transcription regulator